MTDFKLCRVCLVPESDAALSSFHDCRDKAMFFEKFFGVNLSAQEALICDKCCVKVDKVHAFINKTRHLDATYFAALRFLSTCGSDDDGLRVCRCCLSTSHLRGIIEHGSSLVSLLLMTTGVDVQDDRQNVLICSKCEKTLKRADSMDFAVNENHKQHFGNESLEAFRKKVHPEEIKPSKPASQALMHICEECCKDYSTALRLKNHIRNIHKKEKLNCNFCEYSIPTSHHFIGHVSKHLDPSEAGTKRSEQNDFKEYEDSMVCLTCPICKQDSTSVTSLKDHYMRKHQAYRKFECDYCGWRSFAKERMFIHITCGHVLKSLRDVYDKDRPHECTVKGCHKRFKHRKAVTNHKSAAHSGIRHTCWWCQRSYSRNNDLQRHQKKCSGIVKPSHKQIK